jgi:DNA repair exonuclease SbcCD ATPase subunit
VRDDVEGKTLFREMIVSTDNELRESVSLLDGDKEIHRSYDVAQESVRLSTGVCEASKQEIANIQESIAELRQTENALKKQHLDILDQCRKEEERGGVAGFQDIHEQLISVSKETSSMNELTSQMVDEISEMSQKIVRTLDEKEQELEPKVRQIKEKREHFQELQERYKSEKAKHDEALTKLTAEIRVLESECSRRQKDWLEKERLLCSKDGTTTSNVATLPELGNLTKERREQGVNQLTEFANLKKLLELLQAGVPRQ